MANSKEIFKQDFNNLILSAQNSADVKEAKLKYLELVKKYHPDVNHEIDYSILNEYMVIINNIFDKIKNDEIKIIANKVSENAMQRFSFFNFLQILTKIVELGINKKTIKDKRFKKYVNLLILETEKSSRYASEAFNLIFSEEFIIKNNQRIYLFNKAMKFYSLLLKNFPPGFNLFNESQERVAVSYLNEFKNFCKEDGYKDAIEKIMEWLKETNAKKLYNS